MQKYTSAIWQNPTRVTSMRGESVHVQEQHLYTGPKVTDWKCTCHKVKGMASGGQLTHTALHSALFHTAFLQRRRCVKYTAMTSQIFSVSLCNQSFKEQLDTK